MGKRVRIEEKAATKKVAAKPVKAKAEKVPLDNQYLRKLCLEIYRIRIDEDDSVPTRGGKTPSERTLAEYVKKYNGDRAKAEARFEEFAQIYAPVIRVALRVMAEMGDLPEAAKGK
jgi:hypothetical protein